MKQSFTALVVACILFTITPIFFIEPVAAAETDGVPDSLRPTNLVAWCIVPFDARNRTPAERAEMIKRLGMRRVAYDWRAQHVESFPEEVKQYREHGIEFFAFWSWHDAIEPFIRGGQIRPQIWITLRSPSEGSQHEMVARAAESMLPMVLKTRQLGLKLGLYNHGGWGGQPDNLVAVCEHLREHHDADHVGIVYNFHHGHEHIDGFSKALEQMLPYLLCLNLNGMADPDSVDGHTNKILPIGSGKHERAMIAQVIKLGYGGPIGILDHRNEMDAEESLLQNLEGLAALLKTIQ